MAAAGIGVADQDGALLAPVSEPASPFVLTTEMPDGLAQATAIAQRAIDRL